MQFITVLLLLFLVGCQNQRKTGPLTQIKQFEIIPFFSPYEDFDRDLLLATLVQSLETVGDVEIIKNDCFQSLPENSTLFLLSLGGYQEVNRGSIQVTAQVVVEANQFKTNAEIWHTRFIDKNLAFPEDTSNGIVFHKGSGKSTPVMVIQEMLTLFSEDYRANNPQGVRPVMRIHLSKI